MTPAQIKTAFLDSTGTVRRLRALVAIGYSQTDLAAQLGIYVGNFSPLILGKRLRVTTKTHSSVCVMFTELWAHPVQGHAGDRSRSIAASRGWAGPLAWDDIDDPTEVANLVGEEPDLIDEMAVELLIDEMAVELAMRGEPVRLTAIERREAVTRLHGRRWSDNRIADTLRISDRTVLRYRQELGLEAFDFSEIKKVGAP